MRGLLKKYFKAKGYDDEVLVPLGIIRKYFWKINWIKTIWFNFKALPFSQARFLPFILGYRCRIKKVGQIQICGKVSPGMISIGVIRLLTDTNTERLLFSNKGKLLLSGRVKFHPGAKIVIKKNGTLLLGQRVAIGSFTKIFCSTGITMGHDVRISWESQIFDTDFHFLSNTVTGKIYDRKAPVEIGNNVFIGNRCTIGKGTHLCDGTVVSCCSKVSGDFSNDGENVLIVGNPAKVVKKGVQMSSGWFPKKEAIIAKEKFE